MSHSGVIWCILQDVDWCWWCPVGSACDTNLAAPWCNLTTRIGREEGQSYANSIDLEWSRDTRVTGSPHKPAAVVAWYTTKMGSWKIFIKIQVQQTTVTKEAHEKLSLQDLLSFLWHRMSNTWVWQLRSKFPVMWSKRCRNNALSYCRIPVTTIFICFPVDDQPQSMIIAWFDDWAWSTKVSWASNPPQVFLLDSRPGADWPRKISESPTLRSCGSKSLTLHQNNMLFQHISIFSNDFQLFEMCCSILFPSFPTHFVVSHSQAVNLPRACGLSAGSITSLSGCKVSSCSWKPTSHRGMRLFSETLNINFPSMRKIIKRHQTFMGHRFISGKCGNGSNLWYQHGE